MTLTEAPPELPLIATVKPRLSHLSKRAARWILRTGSASGLLWVTVLYFLLCLFIQCSTGAWRAGFNTFADEPSHFVGSVMIRDWLLSGQWLKPFQFATNYYANYPYFALGYWPPLFYLLTALEFLATGVGRMQGLLVPALAAATTAAFVYRFLRDRAGIIPAFCIGVVYLSLPEVQRVLCAVMVDHLTAACCVGFGLCLLRYLKNPTYSNAVLCSVVCSFAILSKYSAGYTAILPFVAVVLLRRGYLLKAPTFLVQPILVALITGPWVLWTKGLMFYGLPAEESHLTLQRLTWFAVRLFGIFPAPVLAVVLAGLIVLAVSRRAWGQDAGILALLCVGHLSFLLLSPVIPEQRYLFAPIVAILVLSAMGWIAALPRIPGAWALAKAAPFACALVASVCLWANFGQYGRPAEHDVRAVVDAVVSNRAWDGQRLVMPSDLEGPIIAEFAARVQDGRGYRLMRPSKLLAKSDWFGENYSLRFATPDEVLGYVRSASVNVVIWHAAPKATLLPHGRLIGEMLQKYPAEWPLAVSLGCGGAASCWQVYTHAPAFTAPQR